MNKIRTEPGIYWIKMFDYADNPKDREIIDHWKIAEYLEVDDDCYAWVFLGEEYSEFDDMIAVIGPRVVAPVEPTNSIEQNLGFSLAKF